MVLVVDDSAFMRKIIMRALTPDHTFIEAADGVGALTEYRKHTPNLVIMDVNMPNKDGMCAAREILETDPRANIIMLTALGQKWAEEEMLRVGVRAFVTKPFRPEELREIAACAVKVRPQNGRGRLSVEVGPNSAEGA